MDKVQLKADSPKGSRELCAVGDHEAGDLLFLPVVGDVRYVVGETTLSSAAPVSVLYDGVQTVLHVNPHVAMPNPAASVEAPLVVTSHEWGPRSFCVPFWNVGRTQDEALANMRFDTLACNFVNTGNVLDSGDAGPPREPTATRDNAQVPILRNKVAVKSGEALLVYQPAKAAVPKLPKKRTWLQMSAGADEGAP